jgi:hypothetical protein
MPCRASAMKSDSGRHALSFACRPFFLGCSFTRIHHNLRRRPCGATRGRVSREAPDLQRGRIRCARAVRGRSSTPSARHLPLHRLALFSHSLCSFVGSWHVCLPPTTAFEARRPMNELVEALRRAVRAEIAAAIAAAGPNNEPRHLSSLAERMEVERCWAYAAAVAAGVGRQREKRNAHANAGSYGPP